MNFLGLAGAAAAVCWAAAPLVSMARRGTVDDRVRAGLRAEAQGDHDAAAEPTVPAPRASAEQDEAVRA